MLAAQLIQKGFPSIELYDRSSLALQLMEDYDVQHLPVVREGKFVGLVAKNDLLDIDGNGVLASLENAITLIAVKGEEHFLTAVKRIVANELSLIPVINEQSELLGVIPADKILSALSVFMGNDEPGGVIVLEIDKRHFSFGEISRLIETNDAYITQLNTYTEKDTGLVIVTVKINKVEISDIVATFQRYDYLVRYYFGEEQFGNELKENYSHLLAYLNM